MKLRRLVLRLALFSAFAACGGGGGSETDGGPADAGPQIDGGSTVDGGGNGSPFTLVQCDPARVADAGPGEPDAGAAGPGGVLDEPCCQPEGECATDFACIVGPTSSDHHCRALCDLADMQCPTGGICANFGGQGVCIAAGEEGDPCAPELCTAANVCVGATADDAVCRRRCESQEGCDDGTTCTAISGAGMACLP